MSMKYHAYNTGEQDSLFMRFCIIAVEERVFRDDETKDVEIEMSNGDST